MLTLFSCMEGADRRCERREEAIATLSTEGFFFFILKLFNLWKKNHLHFSQQQQQQKNSLMQTFILLNIPSFSITIEKMLTSTAPVHLYLMSITIEKMLTSTVPVHLCLMSRHILEVHPLIAACNRKNDFIASERFREAQAEAREKL